MPGKFKLPEIRYFDSGVISFPDVSLASLNSLTPRPMPRIKSGIFLPPKNKRITTKIRISSVPPGMPKRKVVIGNELNICVGLIFLNTFRKFTDTE